MTEKNILLYRTRTKRRLSLVPSGVRPPGAATREARARTRGVSLGRGVGHVDRHALDDVVLATQGLGHLQQARVTCHVAGGRQGTLTSGSRKVMKANALKGFGMKTSVTSPNFEKYSFRSSAVMSSVHRPTNTLHGTCCTWGKECQIFLVHVKYF